MVPGAPASQPPASQLVDEVLPAVMSLVLEGRANNVGTLPYYQCAAQHANAHDPALVGMVGDVVQWIRDRYRSARQHEFHARRVPVTKQVDPEVRARLDGDCAICLRPLRDSGHGIVRVKPASGLPYECGHFFHRDCIGEWELRRGIQPKSCPLCRADLGVRVQTWEDHESVVPSF